MPIVAVVADANVLLSATVGKAALRVFTEFAVDVHATTFNADEVERYLPHLSEKYELPQGQVELQWRLLPVRLHDPDDDGRPFEAASRDLAHRDPDDAHPLALTRALGLPLWSNDKDLHGLDVLCYTTAALLRELEQ